MKKYSYSSPNSTMIIKVMSKDRTSKKPNKLSRAKSNKTISRMTVQPSKMSKMLLNLSANNSSDQLTNKSTNRQTNQSTTHGSSNATDPQTDPQSDCVSCSGPECESCKQTTKSSAPVEFKTTTTPSPPPASWKHLLGQRIIVKKTSGVGSEHSSTINSTMDLDINIRPNRFGADRNSSSVVGPHRNLDLKSILKKSKLLAPRYSAKQTMPNMPNNTLQQTNYLSQDSLNALPACTILDVFCWCYRLTRFLFIVRY